MTDTPRRPPRSTSLLLEPYATRVLIGWVCSLCALLIAFQLPVDRGESPIHWSSSRSTQTIPISEIKRDDEPSETDESPEDEGAPPPTQLALPSADSRAGTTDGDGADSGNDGSTSGTQSDTAPSTETIPVAGLAANDNTPEIIGGKGALYLQINYPYKARVKGIEGRLKLKFTITRNGDVRQIEVKESLHPLCDSAAIQGLRAVRFRPAERDGEPVPVRMSLPIRFELSKPDTSALHTRSRPESDR